MAGGGEGRGESEGGESIGHPRSVSDRLSWKKIMTRIKSEGRGRRRKRNARE